MGGTVHHRDRSTELEGKEVSFGMSAGATSESRDPTGLAVIRLRSLTKGFMYPAVEKPDYSEAKIVVAMVGLPARGKSYLSNKLQRYLLVRSPSEKSHGAGQG